MSEKVDLEAVKEFVRGGINPQEQGNWSAWMEVAAIAHIEALVAEVERLRDRVADLRERVGGGCL